MGGNWYVQWCEYGIDQRNYRYCRFSSYHDAFGFYLGLVECPSAWEIRFPALEFLHSIPIGTEIKEEEFEFE